MNERILANSPSYLPPSPMLFHAMAQGGKEMGRRPSATCLSCQGTTGSPKGATLSHHNIVNNSNMIGERLRLHMKTPESSRVVLPSPLYHCLGSVGGTIVSMMYGVTLILSSPIFDGKKALEAISRERWASVGSYPRADEPLLSLTPGP